MGCAASKHNDGGDVVANGDSNQNASQKAEVVSKFDQSEPTPSSSEPAPSSSEPAPSSSEPAASQPEAMTESHILDLNSAGKHFDFTPYFDRAEKLLEKQGKQPDAAVINALKTGLLLSNFDGLKPKTMTRLFTSSTFSDTKRIRNNLMVHCYPRLREILSVLGLDLQIVDMRWGVRDETGNNHGTSELCMAEVARCLNSSVGPAFVFFSTSKYGYRPFPARVKKELLDILFKTISDTNALELLKKWYQLDENSVPESYILVPISSHLPDYLNKTDRDKQRAASGQWWSEFEIMQMALRNAAISAHQEQQISEQDLDLFRISVTNEEVLNGIIRNSNRNNNTLCLLRDFGTSLRNAPDGRFIDMSEGKIDEDAQSLLSELRKTVCSLLPEQNVVPSNLVFQPHEKVMDFGEEQGAVVKEVHALSDKLANMILEGYEREKLHLEDLTQELVSHHETMLGRANSFVGRRDLIEKIVNYASDTNVAAKKKLVVLGESGTGKTSVMSRSIFELMKHYEDKPDNKPLIMFRFVGTSAASANVFLLLKSICDQFKAIDDDEYMNVQYDMEDFAQQMGKTLVGSFDEICDQFWRLCAAFASPERPLIIFIDSLDQLSDEYEGRKLLWLVKNLPPHVSIVVSAIPKIEGHDISQWSQTECEAERAESLQISVLGSDDLGPIFDKMLSNAGRQLSGIQYDAMMSCFNKQPTPLFLTLAVSQAKFIRSFDGTEDDFVQSILKSENVPDLINVIFDRLERIHGKKLVSATLGLVTVSETGLSAVELDDIISCDDEVLDDIYEWWTPAIRRLPPMLWLRIRQDLGYFLSEVGVDGRTVYRWHHRQFWETAERRYLAGADKTKRATAIANYFLGDHSWTEEKSARQIQKQSLMIKGKPNLRVLSELGPALVVSGDEETFFKHVCALDFMACSLNAGRFWSLIRQLQSMIDSSSDQRPIAEALLALLRKYQGVFANKPTFAAMWQLAISSPKLRDFVIESLKSEDFHVTAPSLMMEPKADEDAVDIVKASIASEIQIESASFISDSRLALAADRDLELWSTEGQRQTGLKFEKQINEVLFDDKRNLIYLIHDGAITAVNAKTLVTTWQSDVEGLEVSEFGSTSVFFDPSVSQLVYCKERSFVLATIQDDGTVIVKEEYEVRTKKRAPYSAAVSKDSKYVALGIESYEDYCVVLYKPGDEKQAKDNEISVGMTFGQPKAVAFHPTKPVLVSTCWNNVMWFDIVDDELQGRCEVPHAPSPEFSVMGLTFNSEGTHLASAGEDGRIKVWIYDESGTRPKLVPVLTAGVGPTIDRLVPNSANTDDVIALCNNEIRRCELKGLPATESTTFEPSGQFLSMICAPQHDVIVCLDSGVGMTAFSLDGDFIKTTRTKRRHDMPPSPYNDNSLYYDSEGGRILYQSDYGYEILAIDGWQRSAVDTAGGKYVGKRTPNDILIPITVKEENSKISAVPGSDFGVKIKETSVEGGKKMSVTRFHLHEKSEEQPASNIGKITHLKTDKVGIPDKTVETILLEQYHEAVLIYCDENVAVVSIHVAAGLNWFYFADFIRDTLVHVTSGICRRRPTVDFQDGLLAVCLDACVKIIRVDDENKPPSIVTELYFQSQPQALVWLPNNAGRRLAICLFASIEIWNELA